MAWVGISDLGGNWTLLREHGADVSSGNSEFTMSSAAPSDAWFLVEVLRWDGIAPRMRATVVSYSADGGHDGAKYTPAYFELNRNAALRTHNQAPPYPAPAFPGASGVDSFLPGELIVDGEVDGAATVQFEGARYGDADTPLGESWVIRVEAWDEGGGGGDTGTEYNCDCDDGQPRVTLQEMRNRLARRLGFSVQVSMGALPPGMSELLDDFIRSTHELMYQRYSVMRMRRMFTWEMEQGVRFYDLDGNADECARVLNPDKLEWVGISQGDSSWRPLICGINPVLYGSHGTGIPSHYEIRQCIEVWPAPTDDTWQLRIKGDFGLSALDADDDVLTVDPEAVFLQALANAKAHYGQADAANYASQATAYVRSRVAGAHQTRRYIPGSCVPPPMVRPVLKED